MRSISAGCGDRHAYRTIEAFGAAEWHLEVGAPCDATRRAPFRVRIEIAGRGFDGFDGSRFRLRIGAGPPSWFPSDGVSVKDGRFVHAVDDLQSPPDGNAMELLIDRNGDGTCDPHEDIAWVSSPTEVDALSFTLRFAITPPERDRNSDEYCRRWN